MKIKKIISIILLILIIIVCMIGLSVITKNASKNNATDKIQVVVSNFASYDFLRAIIGDNQNVELTFLIGPGKYAHSYEPTAQDITKIQNSDLFVYIGGSMESWSDSLIENLSEAKPKIICISDGIEKIDEIEHQNVSKENLDMHIYNEGSEKSLEVYKHDEDSEKILDVHNHEENSEEDLDTHNHEHTETSFDEHIWTSPSKAIAMVNVLKNAMVEIDKENAPTYELNAAEYIKKIKEVDKKIQEIVDSKVRNTLIFGDKMPMQYFIEYYGLEVYAAFSGCSTEIEPSAKTIASLVNKIREENIPVILYIELNDGSTAKTIANEAGNDCKVMQIQTLHNISKDDFENGETWVSLMTKNIEVISAALQ